MAFRVTIHKQQLKSAGLIWLIAQADPLSVVRRTYLKQT